MENIARQCFPAVRDILHEAKAEEKIQQFSFDSASEFLSADMATMLRNLGPEEDRGEGGGVSLEGVVHAHVA